IEQCLVHLQTTIVLELAQHPMMPLPFQLVFEFNFQIELLPSLAPEVELLPSVDP
ncbi:hypothetical protein A2U01_0118874, partial [Trifolium medium]|nr:hypothetical protein [Trifolium medium]